MRSVSVVKNIVGNYSLQYSFDITIPNLPGADGFLVKFLATGVSTPKRTIQPVDVWWRGRKGEIPGSIDTFGDLDLTLNIDSNWLIYDQLYAAMQFVMDGATGLSKDWRLYAFKVFVGMLQTPLDVPIRKFTLKDCYVKEIGAITKDHSKQMEKDSVPLKIHFDDWDYGI